MAHRRSVTVRAAMLMRWYRPSLSHIVHCNDSDDARPSPSPSQHQWVMNNFIHQKAHNQTIVHVNGRTGAFFGWSRFGSSLSLVRGVGPSFCRYFSSAIGEGSDKVDYISDVAEVLTEKNVEAATSHAPVVNEVAVSASDSAFPVAALQYLIDAMHSFTGLNWWAAIAITTILIRGATLPLLINQLKATSKLNLIRPQLEEIKQGARIGLLIYGPVFISFFFAISNIVEKVPSFKVGGAFRFTDLTAPDATYIFPVLASLSFLITVE
ncbi:hypothetical protein Ancab_005622, partial [Ancistrocladus abbreviatus]